MRKNIFLCLAILIFLASSSCSALAATKHPPIHVTIVSPKEIRTSPVCDQTIDILVMNTSDRKITNLGCYLTIVDVGRKQTYPVDEFGDNAYQTRTISSLRPGEKTVIQIPVHVLYVGKFRFTASVIQYSTDKIFTADALPVHMTAVSNLNKGLVMAVSACVAIILTGGVILLTRIKKPPHNRKKCEN